MEHDNWEVSADNDQTKLLVHEDDGQIYVTKGTTGPDQPWEVWRPEVRKDGETIDVSGPWEVDPEEGVWPMIEAVMQEYWGDSRKQ